MIHSLLIGMDPAFRHCRSPSSDRFLGISSSSSTSASSDGGGELNEDDILWTNDPTEPNHHHNYNNNNNNHAFTPLTNHSRSSAFTHQQNSGILAALPEQDSRSILNRKNSISSSTSSSVSSSKMIPTIPKPLPMESSQSTPNNRKFQHSAPMNVPVLSIAMAKQRNSRFLELDEEEAEDEMLPPHEIVARGSGVSPKTTFSVLEGVGRTLKGRDLRQVRNAVFRQTGFLD